MGRFLLAHPVRLCPQPDRARNLGIILNSKLTMTSQVNSVSSFCIFILRMLCKIFKWLPQNCTRPKTQALVTSRLDYGNALYVRLSAHFISELSS